MKFELAYVALRLASLFRISQFHHFNFLIEFVFLIVLVYVSMFVYEFIYVFVFEFVQGASKKMLHSDSSLKSVPGVGFNFFRGVCESEFRAQTTWAL